MRQLQLPDPKVQFPDDVARLRRALNEIGYDSTPETIAAAYKVYSEEEWAAGWMGGLEREEHAKHIAHHLIDYGYLVKASE